jgi:hypothetical protein
VPDYDTLKNKQTELIRKALDGSAFLAPVSADAIDDLTTYAAGPPVVIDLTPLPTGYDDLGWLTTEGMAFSREVAQSDIGSFGSVSPTRTDIQSDTSSVTVVCQETKMLTIGLATGQDLSGIVPDANSGEVKIIKPTKPSSRAYRLVCLATDLGDAGEIYIARFFPRAKVSSYSEQSFSQGDEAITWGVTFTGEEDSTLGYSEAWLFGGPGWKALTTAMGF